MKARLTPALFAHADAVLAALLKFDHPADAVTSRYFREHKQLGHADRGFVAETVFAVLRRLPTLKACCAPETTPRRLLLAALVVARGMNLRELAPLLRGTEEAWLAELRGRDMNSLPPEVRADLPEWLFSRLVAQWGEEETLLLARALNQAAPLDLRVNTLKADRDRVLAALQAEGMPALATPYSPWGIRLKDKPALAKHPAFLAGEIEVQDEGSQLLGCLLEPRRGEMVVDFCAGAGGKTLLLGAMMRNTGRLYALDVSEKRLANLKPRLARSGLSNVNPIRIEHERDARIKRLAGKMDRVLVDAPCSGLGTLRRNPDLKWRQSEASVQDLSVLQAKILASAASLVRPGGRLVYATCSVLTVENDAVVDAFLAQHPEFTLCPVSSILGRYGMDFSGERLQLLPHRHQTDGFYAAVLERKV